VTSETVRPRATALNLASGETFETLQANGDIRPQLSRPMRPTAKPAQRFELSVYLPRAWTWSLYFTQGQPRVSLPVCCVQYGRNTA